MGHTMLDNIKEIQDEKRLRNDARKMAMELILICARDIVDAWPHTTMRTLGNMTKRMDTLRQALEAAGK
jgi:hypothetical protein